MNPLIVSDAVSDCGDLGSAAALAEVHTLRAYGYAAPVHDGEWCLSNSMVDPKAKKLGMPMLFSLSDLSNWLGGT